jgi:tetratricopeptide (TPR) repeat protein
MAALELTLSFAEIDRVTVTLTDRSPITIPLTSPFTKEDWEDMQWYIESYPVQYAADVDDRRADRIVSQLKTWGQGLFNAVFADRSAERLFNAFQDAEGEGRQLTIAASQPEILRLPWELLCDPSGTYLVHENPRIAVRRQLAGAGGGRKPVEVKPKAQLRLLMVVSRPDGVGFIDPRAEGQAVLQAIGQTAPGRVVVEFLRPATLTKLVERLESKKLPAIDIVHFDGHGTFATSGEAGTGKQDDGLSKGSQPQGMGYLIFEDEDGKKQLVSAAKLGDALNRQKVSLMVLSACQSAMVTGDDALGCVAARLTHGGIPAVLAMTYSVLVTTTEQLFGKFYGELAGGESLGVALANARRDLFMRKRRGQRWRGTEQIELELSDWFLPAWYQAGGDIKLLKQAKTLPPVASPKQQLPELAEEGFFGRSWELWQIERAFVQGTRRITIAGFGGQGKTYLAVEAGRWLAQTGMFDTVCFVDYAAFQGVDAVGVAVAEIGVVLEQSLINAAAVTTALRDCRTLVILDNLESLDAAALHELLTVAKEWSQVGETRLLLTTRDGGMSHADYPAANSRQHQLLPLSGLGKEDAIRYFQGLMKLPPAPKWDLPPRAALIELFELVQFHPLSIKLVAYQLKERRVADLARSLEALLAAEPQADKQRCLVASLNLSLQRLDKDLLELLPRLGVFQGGACELQIMEFIPEQWQQLRLALERTGLVQIEMLDNITITFLQFHPTLAPILWRRLSDLQQVDLSEKYQQIYYELADYLYRIDSLNPYQSGLIARRELPNLLCAVKGALQCQAEYVVEFVDRVNHFLESFGLQRDLVFLTDRLSQFIGAVGSNNWYLGRSNQGDLLFKTGRYSEAAAVFDEILQNLGTEPSFSRINTLMRLARCLRFQGRSLDAARYLEGGVNLSIQLESSESVTRQLGNLHADLGDVFTELWKFEQAQKSYQNSLTIKEETGDRRGVAVVKNMMGILATKQGKLSIAIQLHKEALQTFQQLKEPEQEAAVWHQVGMVYQTIQQWERAEQAYRESAKISERHGYMVAAAHTYAALATLNERKNQPIEAEAWYQKALKCFRSIGGNENKESKVLYNLADFLANQPNRLLEARQVAVESLNIKKTLDPAAAEIWTIYNLLARIATMQGETNQASEYRQLARSTKAAYAGTEDELEQHALFIGMVVEATKEEAARDMIEQLLVQLKVEGEGTLVAAIQRILDGERSVETLWDGLNANASMMIDAILRRL